MDPSRPAEAPGPTPETLEFVRFCYRRRRVGWPELYDEMCAVAGRGLFRGWRFAELESHGIGFSLHQTLELARIAGQVAVEEGDRRNARSVRDGCEPANVAIRAEVGPAEAPPIRLAAIRDPEEERSFDVRIVTSAPVEPSTASVADAGASDPSPPLVAIPMAPAIPIRPSALPTGPTLVPALVRSPVGAG